MDLARIRQKARQEQQTGEAAPEKPAAQPAPPTLPPVPPTAASAVRPEQTASAEALSPLFLQPAAQTVRPTVPFDPVATILAGRRAAGCDDDSLAGNVDQEQVTVSSTYEEFLCVRVSNETYGINIMQIKEIIKPREVTEVPHAPHFVSGIISLRGIIIPVISMLDRLGLTRKASAEKERIVVVKSGEEFAGLLVDEVVQVVRIEKNSCEAAPAVLEGIDRDFVSGIGRADHRMIIMLNVAAISDINLF